MIPRDPSHSYGFRVAGGLYGRRLRGPAVEAFERYCAGESPCDGDETYLSVFQFGEDFKSFQLRTNGVRDFVGSTWATWIWFDIDRSPDQGGLVQGLEDLRSLISTVEETFDAPRRLLLPFFSGSKGFHLGLPTELWRPSPGDDFSEQARRFVHAVVNEAKITIDSSIYSRVSLIRAPNTRNPKTGLFKRHIPAEQIDTVSVREVVDSARDPFLFQPTLATAQDRSEPLVSLWAEAAVRVAKRRDYALQVRNEVREGVRPPDIWSVTRRVLAANVPEGKRNTSLFKAALNLAEYGVPLPVIEELLRYPAIQMGLSEYEIDRTIENGYRRVFDLDE